MLCLPTTKKHAGTCIHLRNNHITSHYTALTKISKEIFLKLHEKEIDKSTSFYSERKYTQRTTIQQGQSHITLIK